MRVKKEMYKVLTKRWFYSIQCCQNTFTAIALILPFDIKKTVLAGVDSWFNFSKLEETQEDQDERRDAQTLICDLM